MKIEERFKALQKRLNTQEFDSICFTYLPQCRIVELEIIIVNKNFRRKGIASKAINKICKLCDETETLFVLFPSAEFGIPRKVLVKFYRSFGFYFTGERDFSDRFTIFMKRFPKQIY